MTGYRTLAFSLLLSALGVVQAFNWATIIPQNQAWSGTVMIAIGAVVALLRTITTTPIGVAK